MLTRLDISNLAIVKKLNADFEDGFSVITGETGAGKSILLTAISLLLGEKAKTHHLPLDVDYCEVQGHFRLSAQHPLQLWLVENHQHHSDGSCIITRRIDANHRSKMQINGYHTTLANIRAYASSLVIIHNQHLHHTLVETAQQLTLLDQFGCYPKLIQTVRSHFSDWKQHQQAIERYQMLCDQSTERLALIRYQLTELDDLDPQPDEMETLQQDYKKQTHSKACRADIEQALSALSQHPQANAYKLTHDTLQSLQAHQATYPPLGEVCNMLNEANTLIQEASHDVQSFYQSIQPDEQALSHIQSRLTRYHTLARKHQIQPEQLWKIKQDLTEELDTLTTAHTQLAQCKIQANEALECYTQAANALHTKRQSASEQLAKCITQHIQKLGMQQGRFTISFNKQDHPTAQGNAYPCFNLSANPGHPPQPLGNIASGGERSRLSLVLHLLCQHAHHASTLLYDEVDTGISGHVAEKVGQLLREIASNQQVLCITHLAQVASQAAHHYGVTKSIDHQQTASNITKLTHTERIHALASLIGGTNITQMNLDHAQQLYDSAQDASTTT